MGKGFDKGNETTVLFDRRHWDEREGRGGVEVGIGVLGRISQPSNTSSCTGL